MPSVDPGLLAMAVPAIAVETPAEVICRMGVIVGVGHVNKRPRAVDDDAGGIVELRRAGRVPSSAADDALVPHNVDTTWVEMTILRMTSLPGGLRSVEIATPSRR